MTGIEVDDAQSPHPDRGRAVGEVTGVVRSAMAEYVAHVAKQIGVCRALPIEITRYAAHAKSNPYATLGSMTPHLPPLT